ncbi:STAS domain-containing protein [Actinoplanes oblitus]|uniref:STAS domain-containing protein n=1 Tax=Actinoplanes oblitus TaxID=3040509 RepID=A0ABY8W5K8_9ACTN|nr:STAS domain-containing protein [Actinoplanes oblitus]WIM93129.1 STAS domain-containing protein [Actinoplanes oblitus]
MSPSASGAADSDPVTPVIALTAGGNELTIRLGGELDGTTAPALAAQLGSVISVGPVQRVVVDLSDVEFCDAATVRVFVVLAAALDGRGAALRLHGARPHIEWLLRQLGAADLLSDR